jgi:hypothetical protein
MELRYDLIIGFIYHITGKYVKCINPVISKFFTCLIFFAGFLFTGCLKTEGTLKLRGKVLDEFTKDSIPGRQIFVQGLAERDEKLVPVDAGQFSTDSSGCFRFSLVKVKNARFYNFSIVGDSNYSFRTVKLGLMDLQQNAKYLSFSLKKLVDLKIRIYNKVQTPFIDTLYLSWKSDDVDFKILYPYKIDNYRQYDNFRGVATYYGLVWIGVNTNSIVNTRVFADKMTLIRWEFIRNKKRKEIIDTIVCKRDITNLSYFIY